MNKKIYNTALILFSLTLLTSCSATKLKINQDGQVCGPQAPRDIANPYGENEVTFPAAPSYKNLNLCNIHFHKNAEHKGPGFSVLKGVGKHGGYACNEKVNYQEAKFRAFGKGACKGIEAGDTIEVHWVHSSCSVKPGPTLGSCLAKDCPNPKLRVETQVFLLVNDKNGPSFLDYTKLTSKKSFHQANKLPSRNGAVSFLGSTTGPKYNNKCSPFKVSWSVTPRCQTLDISTVHKWCENNVFKENHAHGIRVLVKDTQLLSPIR